MLTAKVLAAKVRNRGNEVIERSQRCRYIIGNGYLKVRFKDIEDFKQENRVDSKELEILAASDEH